MTLDDRQSRVVILQRRETHKDELHVLLGSPWDSFSKLTGWSPEGKKPSYLQRKLKFKFRDVEENGKRSAGCQRGGSETEKRL